MPDKLSFFKNTYEESLTAFVELASSSGGELRTHRISSEFSFHSLYLAPSNEKRNLLILTSGIHGIEGFTGSALQRYFLSSNLHNVKDENTGLLIIHGINPFGFQNKRRVNENNVDLNRNFDTSEELFNNDNPGYHKLFNFLNPSKRYSRLSFYAYASSFILKHGIENLRKAILKGQYQFPRGIFFGGQKFEPQVSLIKHEVTKAGEGFSNVVLVDIHTGYGQRGKLHLFGDRSIFIDKGHMNEVFKSLHVEYGQDKDFYSVTGGLTVFLAKVFHQKSKFAGVVFEFGTIDSQKALGSLGSLYRMVNDNQKMKTDKDKALFEEMFYPKSPEWRSGVIQQFEKTIKIIMDNISK